jgi:CO/xanthine dehydrogenase FAD-binding subunit
VAVARLPVARGAGQARVRVALTGLGPGVRRWAAAEQALAAHWGAAALDGLQLPATAALGDVLIDSTGAALGLLVLRFFGRISVRR